MNIVLSGQEFNYRYAHLTFYKALNESLIHNGFKYALGLNVDTLPFNPTGNGLSGGLYFCEENYLDAYLFYGTTKYANITIPNDALVYIETDGKFKTNKFIINNIQKIADLPLWQNKIFVTLAIQKEPMALQYVKEQTEDICQLAVQHNGWALKFVQNQTEEICRLAVQQTARALEYVKVQSPAVCRLAVINNGTALEFVQNQTEELCRLALQQNKEALKYVNIYIKL